MLSDVPPGFRNLLHGRAKEKMESVPAEVPSRELYQLASSTRNTVPDMIEALPEVKAMEPSS